MEDYDRKKIDRFTNDLLELKSECIEIAKLFPHMRHYLMKWQGYFKPHIQSGHFSRSLKNGLCIKFKEHDAIFYPDYLIEHWVLRPQNQSWRLDVARRRVEDISRKGIDTIKNYLKNNTILIKLLNIDRDVIYQSDKVELWLLMLHKYQEPHPLAYGVSAMRTEEEIMSEKTSATLIFDVFQASANFCDYLLRQLESVSAAEISPALSESPNQKVLYSLDINSLSNASVLTAAKERLAQELFKDGKFPYAEKLFFSGQLRGLRLLEAPKDNKSAKVCWIPRSLGEYFDLAKVIIDASLSRAKDPTNDLFKIYHLSYTALQYAQDIIYSFRQTKLNTYIETAETFICLPDGSCLSYIAKKHWVLNYCALDVSLGRLDAHGHYWLGGSEMFDGFNWPQNPQSRAFYEAGICALQAIIRFCNQIHKIVDYGNAFFNIPVNPLEIKIEPAADDAALKKWESIVQFGLKKYLPDSEWTDGAIDREFESLQIQLNAEYEQALKQKLLNQPENHRVNQHELVKLTDTESNILEALGAETLIGAKLLTKAGYDNSSHYRQILSNLCKRKILDRNPNGYFRMTPDNCQ
ncbi:MAG: hypothetical protein ACYTBV_09960 [Planctomycetota bacterium]